MVRFLTVGPHVAAFVGLALAALVAAGVSQCSPAPVSVVELPAVVEVETMDPRGPVRRVMTGEELEGELIRTLDVLGELVVTLDECPGR